MRKFNITIFILFVALIKLQGQTPEPPDIGTITQPTCDTPTGSVELTGLPSIGTWTLRGSDGSTITDEGESYTVTGLVPGTYTWTVEVTAGDPSLPSDPAVIIYEQPPTPDPPAVSTITQPTCSNATGSVVLNNLPSGDWIISPGNITGNTSSYTVTGLTQGTYNFTVTNEDGCTSQESDDVEIDDQPTAPDAPTVSKTDPTCSVATGTITVTYPLGPYQYNIDGGTYQSLVTFNGVAVGTHNIRVRRSTDHSCISSPSPVTISAQPDTPDAPSVGTITQPTCNVATGSVILNGLPSGSWTINPGGITGSTSSTTISNLTAGTYNYTVTNEDGCTSPESDDIDINAQPTDPTAATVTLTQPTCAVATGTITVTAPTGAYQYNIDGGTYQSSVTFSGVTTGSHTILVRRSTDYTCISAPASATVNAQPTEPSSATVTTTQPTCAVATGTIVVTSPLGAYQYNIDGGTYQTSATFEGVDAGSHNILVRRSTDYTCISDPTSVTIDAQPVTPSPPSVGTITQTSCDVATGSIILNGLPSSGTWTLTRSPGGITASGTGTSTTISGLAAGTYSFTVTNASECTSNSSANVVINVQPVTPGPPVLVTITHPTCSLSTGSVVLSGLPSTGTWTVTRSPDGAVTSGTGTSATIAGIIAGTYTFTVTNASGCTSTSTGNVVINAQPITPAAPVIGPITQPTCTVATGSLVINGLPSAGSWTLTRNPGGITTNGTGTSLNIPVLTAGTYTFTVTNASGCTSPASANVVIYPQPLTPTAPVIGTITQPTLNIPTGSVVLSSLPATGTWTLTRTPGGVTTAGTGTSTTISGLNPGTYTFTVTNASGCISPASATVGLYLLKLYGPDNTLLRSNDTIKINQPDAGSISLNVESNADWTVSDNSLWFKAVKEAGTSTIKVTYMENISIVDKVGALKVTYTSNPEIIVNIKQKARISLLNVSKFKNVIMYPNPAGDFVYMNFGEEEFENIIISIANMQGHIISLEKHNSIPPNQIIELSVSGLSIGQYFIIISDGADHKIFHMIKF